MFLGRTIWKAIAARLLVVALVFQASAPLALAVPADLGLGIDGYSFCRAFAGPDGQTDDADQPMPQCPVCAVLDVGQGPLISPPVALAVPPVTDGGPSMASVSSDLSTAWFAGAVQSRAPPTA